MGIDTENISSFALFQSLVLPSAVSGLCFYQIQCRVKTRLLDCRQDKTVDSAALIRGQSSLLDFSVTSLAVSEVHGFQMVILYISHRDQVLQNLV